MPLPTVQRKNAFIFDTGASSHGTFDKSLFVGEFTPFYQSVNFANGSVGCTTGYGTIKLCCRTRDGTISENFIKDVRLVPDLNQNLMSWMALKGSGFVLEGTGEELVVRDREGLEVMWAKADDSLYVVQEENLNRYCDER